MTTYKEDSGNMQHDTSLVALEKDIDYLYDSFKVNLNEGEGRSISAPFLNIDRKKTTSTPELKQKTLLDMIQNTPEVNKPKPKRKKISPIGISTQNDFDDEIGNENTVCAPDQQGDGDESVKSMIRSMELNFNMQLSIFKKEIKQTLDDNHQALLLEKQAHTKEVLELKGLINEKDIVISDLQQTIENIQKRQCIIEGRMICTEKSVSDLHERQLQTESRSMRDNIVLYNVPELDRENTVLTLKKLLKDDLKIPSSKLEMIKIDRAHRSGIKRLNSRPIIAKVSHNKSFIFQHIKNLDKSKKIIITDQLPQELGERKRHLQPVFTSAKANGKSTRWAGEKLFVDNKPVIHRPDKISDCKLNVMETACSVKSTHTPTTKYKDSEFQGHVMDINNQDEVLPSIFSLYADDRVSKATHNIYAYILSSDSRHEHYEDNGEFGAGRKLLDYLKRNNIVNKLVVVSRWYGGTHLGPARFNYILEAAANAVEMHGHLNY